jgi:hypothetical protein
MNMLGHLLPTKMPYGVHQTHQLMDDLFCLHNNITTRWIAAKNVDEAERNQCIYCCKLKKHNIGDSQLQQIQLLIILPDYS